MPQSGVAAAHVSLVRVPASPSAHGFSRGVLLLVAFGLLLLLAGLAAVPVVVLARWRALRPVLSRRFDIALVGISVLFVVMAATYLGR